MYTFVVLAEFGMLAAGVVALFRGKLNFQDMVIEGARARIAGLLLVLPLPTILILRELVSRSQSLNFLNLVMVVVVLGIVTVLVSLRTTSGQAKSAEAGDTAKTYQRVVALLFAFIAATVVAVVIGRLLWTTEQSSSSDAPLWPAQLKTFTYNSQTYQIVRVPDTDGEFGEQNADSGIREIDVDAEIREWALVERGRSESMFLDPDNPESGVISWEGSWRTLEPVWEPVQQSLVIIVVVFLSTFVVMFVLIPKLPLANLATKPDYTSKAAAANMPMQENNLSQTREKAQIEALSVKESSGTIGSEQSYFFICSGNASLIDAYNALFKVGVLAYNGNAGHYSASVTDLQTRVQEASEASLYFMGQSYMGSNSTPISQLHEVLRELSVAASREIHISFVSVDQTGVSWVHKVYDELLNEAISQGILPYKMYVTKDKDAYQFLLGSFNKIS